MQMAIVRLIGRNTLVTFKAEIHPPGSIGIIPTKDVSTGRFIRLVLCFNPAGNAEFTLAQLTTDIL